MELPEVEPELKVSPPRPMVWASATHDLPEDVRNLLVNGIAVRARVTEADTGWESGYEAGPYYKIRYEYEHDGKTHEGRWSASYDGIHLAYGAGEYMRWLDGAMCDGGTFTVLFLPDAPEKPRVYGTLEPHVKKSLLEAVDELASCTDAELEERSSAVFAFMIAPLGRCQREWRKYYDLLDEMGMYDRDKDQVRDGVENIEVVRTRIRSGDFDDDAMKELSELCARYRPGVWAAT
jgi:hypothetical protein